MALLDDLVDTGEGGPSEAARWRFVRRRGMAVFQAHGYNEARPPLLEPSGLALAAGSYDALDLSQGVELRCDPQASLARLWARSKAGDFSRWMAGVSVFDKDTKSPHRARGWAALTGITVGAADPAADAEAAILLMSLAGDLSLRDGEVIVGTL